MENGLNYSRRAASLGRANSSVTRYCTVANDKPKFRVAQSKRNPQLFLFRVK